MLWLLLVFYLILVPANANFVYLGCYKTASFKKIGNVTITNGISTWASCTDTCYSKFAMYAGMQISEDRMCFCGNQIDNRTFVDESNCNPCQENKDHWCGGNATVSIYQLNPADSSPVLLATDEGIHLIYPDKTSSSFKPLKLTNASATSVDYYYQDQEIYFSSGNTVSKFPYSTIDIPFVGIPICQSSQEDTICDGHNISDMSLDWLNRNLYCGRFKDDINSEVVRAKLDGSDVIQLPTLSDSVFKFISLDPNKRDIFYLDNGKLSKSHIGRSENHTVFRKDIRDFNDVLLLAIDIQQEAVYVIGSYNNESERYLVSLNYNYTDFKVICKGSELSNPVGLDVLNGTVVWANKVEDSTTVYRGQISSPRGLLEKVTPIYTLTQRINSLKIFHPLAQTENMCQKKHCSHSCVVVSPRLARCSCPRNMALADDEKTCLELPTQILLATDEDITLVTKDGPRRSPKSKRILGYGATSVAYRYAENPEVYFISENKIMRTRCDSALTRCPRRFIVKKPNTADCEEYKDLAIDWIENRIFWICVKENSVISANSNGYNVTTVHARTDSLRKVFIEPYARFEVFISKNKLSQRYKDNESKTDILRPYHFQNALELTVDIQQEIIYIIGSYKKEDQSIKFLVGCNYNATLFWESYSGPELSDPFGLHVVNGLVVWGNKYASNNYSVFQGYISPKGNLEKISMIYKGNQKINDLKIYSPEAQNPSPDLCRKKNCSHSCSIMDPLSVQCSCPANMVLADDHNCVDPESWNNSTEIIDLTITTTEVATTEVITISTTDYSTTKHEETSTDVPNITTPLTTENVTMEPTVISKVVPSEEYKPPLVFIAFGGLFILLLGVMILQLWVVMLCCRRPRTALPSVKYDRHSDLVELTSSPQES